MKLTGGEIIVKTLVKEKVPYVLGIPGHGVLCFFDALRKEEKEGNIKYIQVKHEETAAFIADGYYRTCGRPSKTGFLFSRASRILIFLEFFFSFKLRSI